MSRGATPRAVTTEDEVEADSRREARESAVGAAPPHEVSEEKEYDVFRDSLLRYMGYANECGDGDGGGKVETSRELLPAQVCGVPLGAAGGRGGGNRCHGVCSTEESASR